MADDPQVNPAFGNKELKHLLLPYIDGPGLPCLGNVNEVTDEDNGAKKEGAGEKK